jgi:hypothetical protein
MLNLGDGGFGATPYPMPASPTVIALPGNQGPPDLIVSAGFSGPSQGIRRLVNRGDGTFADGDLVPAPGGIFLTAGDFNGDCLPDVAIGIFENCGQVSWSISVLYGLSDGGFSAPQALQARGDAPAGMAPLGPVRSPRALAIVDSCVGGVTVYGDASRH